MSYIEYPPLAPLFGISVDPSVRRIDEAYQRSRIADQHGLDLVTIQDHPYNPDYLDTWTLLASLAMATERVHVGTNVISTPLRPPAMLAKMAATLDELTKGRIELGLGAGAVGPGILAYGGQFGSPSDRYEAFKEAVEIVRGMWANAGGSFSYHGRFHRVQGARPGPSPARPIRIWIGAAGPRMLRLTGRIGDGLLISTPYVPPERLPVVNRWIDRGAAEAGRPPTAIRRGYNLMGVLDLGRPDTRIPAPQAGLLTGDVDYWADTIVRFHRDYRQDTFVFWPVVGNELVQVEAFARDVVPSVRARLADSAA